MMKHTRVSALLIEGGFGDTRVFPLCDRRGPGDQRDPRDQRDLRGQRGAGDQRDLGGHRDLGDQRVRAACVWFVMEHARLSALRIEGGSAGWPSTQRTQRREQERTTDLGLTAIGRQCVPCQDKIRCGTAF